MSPRSGGTSFEGLVEETAAGGAPRKMKTFKDEIRGDVKHDRIGTVGYASAGPDGNASQFYITLRPQVE